MAKCTGQRVTLDGRQGVIIHTQFDGSNTRQECQVKWDDGQSNWEMGEDLRLVPNVQGDAFVAMANGFGVRDEEFSPADVVAQVREREWRNTESQLLFLNAVGLAKLPKVHTNTRERQHTLDVRQRIAHGTPVKGGGNRDPRRLEMAQAAAAGEFQLVRRGRLVKSTTIKPFETSIGFAGRKIMYQSGKMLTRWQKKILNKTKRRNKK